MIDDDGSGQSGTIINNAWKTELYNQIDANPARIAYTPTWGATGSPPTLASSQLTGLYSVSGSVVTVMIHFLLQTGSLVGAGAWYFSLPPGLVPIADVSLSGYITNGSSQFAAAAVKLAPDNVYIVAPGAPNGIGGSLPIVWVHGDNFTVSGTYFV